MLNNMEFVFKRLSEGLKLHCDLIGNGVISTPQA